MRRLFQRLFSRFRAFRPEASAVPRCPALRLENLEERCLLNASTASAAVAPLAAAGNQHHITVVQNLLNQAQTDLAADIQARTQNLANQLTQAQNRVQKLQNLVNWVQTDITADQQAQTTSLANVVARDQRQVNNLTTELGHAQARLTAYQQHGSAAAVSNAQALVQKLQTALTNAQAQLTTDQQLQAQATGPADLTPDQNLLQARQTALTNAQNAVTTIQQEQQNITSRDIANDQAHIQHYQAALAHLQDS